MPPHAISPRNKKLVPLVITFQVKKRKNQGFLSSQRIVRSSLIEFPLSEAISRTSKSAVSGPAKKTLKSLIFSKIQFTKFVHM